jgi:hypothetical protein
MIKSQIQGKDMYCILDSEQLQHQSKYCPFCFTAFVSFQEDINLLEACESTDCTALQSNRKAASSFVNNVKWVRLVHDT